MHAWTQMDCVLYRTVVINRSGSVDDDGIPDDCTDIDHCAGEDDNALSNLRMGANDRRRMNDCRQTSPKGFNLAGQLQPDGIVTQRYHYAIIVRASR